MESYFPINYGHLYKENKEYIVKYIQNTLQSSYSTNLQEFIILNLLENYLSNNKTTLFLSQSFNERKMFIRSLKNNKKIDYKIELDINKQATNFKFEESSLKIDNSFENILNNGLEKLLMDCYYSKINKLILLKLQNLKYINIT